MSCSVTQLGMLCAIVCDGAGSAEHGGEGASVVAHTMSRRLREHAQDSLTLPEDDQIWSWVDEARDRLAIAAERRSTTPRSFASTMVMVVYARGEIVTAHVGDGAIVARSDMEWTTLSPPESGPYAATTYFVTDDPAPRLRIGRHEGDWTGLALFSDGIENLVLDYQTDAPHAPFFNSMIAPIDAVSTPGKDAKLSAALAGFLRSPKVCDKTDDDKTLLLLSAR